MATRALGYSVSGIRIAATAAGGCIAGLGDGGQDVGRNVFFIAIVIGATHARGKLP